MQWRRAATSGVLAGVVYLVAQVTQSEFMRAESPWSPLLRVAALVLGPDVASSVPRNDLVAVLLVGLLIHAGLSALFGVLVARVTQRLGEQGAVLGGVVSGAALYVVNFQCIAPLWFPWFEVGGGGITLWDHVVFGVLVAVFHAGRRSPSVP